MKPIVNLPLSIGLILNLVRLLIINSGAETWLREHWKLPTWFWHFVGGAAAALMLLGLALAFRPQWGEKLCQWKNNLFGG